MRILQVHNHYRDPGGEDVVVDREAAVLRSAGHDVDQLLATNLGSSAATIASLAKARWNRTSADELAERIDAFRPDVVHIHNTWFQLSPSVIAAASDKGVATVMTLHNYRLLCVNGQLLRDGAICESCLTDDPNQAIRQRCYRDSLPLSSVASWARSGMKRAGVWDGAIDRFITMAPQSKERFVRWGLPAARIAVVPHRFADPGLRSIPPSESATLLFVGRLEEAKGLRQLCSLWTSHDNGTELMIIGDGPLRAELQAAYPAVRWMGHLPRDEVDARMKAARLIVLPSIWPETFGNVIAEAVGCGTPALVSKHAPIGDVVNTAGAGATFDPDSADSWAAALAATGDATVDRWSVNARRLFDTNYTEDGGESLLSVYDEAIASRARGMP